MKAKTLTAKLKWRLNHRGNRGYSVGRKLRFYRGFMPNNVVLYRGKTHLMSCIDGETTMVKI